ncbi:MAG: oligoendopeptidase F, partial [Chloroflexi bacterium]|nr:oligoendopeptidase F [Chloroflexota bacterium]
MSESKIRTRPEIPAQYKWNAESVFASDEAWEAEAQSVLAMLPEVQAFQGHLAEGSGKVADAMDAF